MKKILGILAALTLILGICVLPVNAETETSDHEIATESPMEFEIYYNENLYGLSVGETLHVEVTMTNPTEEDYDNIWVGMGVFETTEEGGLQRLQELVAEDTESCVGTEQGAYFATFKSGQTETLVYECEIPEEWVEKNIVLLGANSQTTNDTIIAGDFSNYIFEEIILWEEGYVLPYATSSGLDWGCGYDNLYGLAVGDTIQVDVQVENNTEEDYENVWVGMGIFEITEEGGMSRLQELVAEDTEDYVGTEQGTYIKTLKKGQSVTLVYECEVPEEWAGKNIVLFGAISQTTNDTIIPGDFSNYIFEEIIIREEGFVKGDPAEVIRLFGDTRYETGYQVAETYKEKSGVEKFDAIIIATGKNFADALSGSYLAVVKNAPILLTNGKEDNIAELHQYMKENVNENGTIYILGGEKAVPESVEDIEGFEVKRLSGDTRYDTNIEILKEAGIEGDELIVATGKTYADSLSASALKMPILLVKPGAALNDEQKEIVQNFEDGIIYIIGGENAVSAEIENELAEYYAVERVYGDSRYETSVAVAERFFGNVDTVVLASGKNFPDGLCGGPLAAVLDAPLILTADKKTEAAADCIGRRNIAWAYVLGGTEALPEAAIAEIF